MATRIGLTEAPDQDSVSSIANKQPAGLLSLVRPATGPIISTSLETQENDSPGPMIGDRYPGRVKPLSRQAYRTLRRRGLHHRKLLKRQIAGGRPDPTWRWCGNANCSSEALFFSAPQKYLELSAKTRQRLPAKKYVKDFTSAMIDKLYPESKDPRYKKRKVWALESFICSPPVISAYQLFAHSFGRRQLTHEEFQGELIKALPHLQPFVHGRKTNIHEYLTQKEDDAQLAMGLAEIIAQFFINVELWRMYETRRSAEWSFGPKSLTAELTLAILLNFWVMDVDGCFFLEKGIKGQRWDRIWDEWLEKYPFIENDRQEEKPFVLRRKYLEETEDVVLKYVGYLGGVGTQCAF